VATKRKAPQGCIWHKESLQGAAMVNAVRVRWPLHTDNPKIARQRREATVDAAIARKFEKLGIGHRLKAPEDGAKTYTDALEALPHYFADRAVEGSTQGRYFCSLAQIDEHLSGKRLSDITGELIAEIVKARRAQGVTSATIKRDLVALSAVMNAAVAEGWIDANPVLPRLKNIKEKRGPIVLPERAHIDLVIARASGMVADIIEAAVRTGAREDELIKLRRSDIDHDRRQMTLWRRGDGGPKGGKTHLVDLVPFDGYAHLRSLPPMPSPTWSSGTATARTIRTSPPTSPPWYAAPPPGPRPAASPSVPSGSTTCATTTRSNFSSPDGTSMTCRSGWAIPPSR
jgi:integrase/recombinase XerD